MIALKRVIPIVLLGLGATLLPTGLAAGATSPTETCYSGSAFGTQVTIGSTVSSGQSASTQLGCTSVAGLTRKNSVASVSDSTLLDAGVVSTTASSADASGTASAEATVRTEGVSLLGGLVTAKSVTAVSTTNDTAGKLSVSPAGTTLVDLTVAGVRVTGNPAANTQLTLPGVGYVILNQQQSWVYSPNAHLTVTGIHVDITITGLLGKAGTQIFVSQAHSALTVNALALMSGSSFGTQALVGSVALAGASFVQYEGCLGTNGKTLTDAGASVSIPSVLTSGTISDTAEGVVTSADVSGTMSSTIEGLDLLSGLVTASTIDASVSESGNPASFTDNSKFVGLSVKGFPSIGDDPAPNTKVSIPGLGVLYLNKVVKANASTMKVIMVQLDVTATGAVLKLNTVVNVGVAMIGVH
ncbi:MAG: choice-of-anchor P family protein [Acidimicrobiales bacterium]